MPILHKDKLVQDAIEDAMFLMSEEFETVIDDEIAERYEATLNKLQIALDLLQEK